MGCGGRRHRSSTRPILLTAAAASMGMIPISREVFWGPMAYAMIGGIIVGTLLTLLFLPALYVAWFRIKAPSRSKTNSPRRTRHMRAASVAADAAHAAASVAADAAHAAASVAADAAHAAA